MTRRPGNPPSPSERALMLPMSQAPDSRGHGSQLPAGKTASFPLSSEVEAVPGRHPRPPVTLSSFKYHCPPCHSFHSQTLRTRPINQFCVGQALSRLCPVLVVTFGSVHREETEYHCHVGPRGDTRWLGACPRPSKS